MGLLAGKFWGFGAWYFFGFRVLGFRVFIREVLFDISGPLNQVAENGGRIISGPFVLEVPVGCTSTCHSASPGHNKFPNPKP